jgi:hypothetical protein
MFRQSLVKAVRPAIRSSLPARATFTTSSRVMAEGDTGGIRPGGGAQGYVSHVTEKSLRRLIADIWGVAMRSRNVRKPARIMPLRCERRRSCWSLRRSLRSSKNTSRSSKNTCEITPPPTYFDPYPLYQLGRVVLTIGFCSDEISRSQGGEQK